MTLEETGSWRTDLVTQPADGAADQPIRNIPGRKTDMIYQRPASLAVATVIGAMLMATPAHARFRDGRGSGGFAVAPVGDFGGVHGGFVRGRAIIGRSPHGSRLIVSHRQFVPPFTPISAFYSYGPSNQSGGQFVTPVDGVGVFYEQYLSCWTWVPAGLGWQRVWECK